MTQHPGTLSLVRPPSLRTTETRAASRLELFFDLAYVLAVAKLAATLLAELDWAAVAEFTALFTLVWLSWVGFTLYANRFDTDDVIFRFAKFVAMAAILGCAASMSAATESQSAAFIGSYLLGRLVLVGLYARAWRHVPAARPTISVYLVGMSVVAALWAVALLLDKPATFWVWGAAALVDVAVPVVASRRPGRAPLHLEHLPERFGLLVILVFGEVIAAIVTGIHDTVWAPTAVWVAVAALVVAAAGWWLYFDVSGSVSARALQLAEDKQQQEIDGQDSSANQSSRDERTARDAGTAPVDERHDLFIFGHLPLTAGVVAAGVGVEELIVHSSTTLPSQGSWLLVAGLATFSLGAALVQGGSQKRPLRAALWPGTTAVVLLALGWVGPADAVTFTTVVALVMAATAATGTALTRRTT